MADLRKTFAHLDSLRRRFEAMLAAARKASPRGADRPGRLREIANFGSNPGNLRMFAHVPDRLPRGSALVLALHGCTHSADAYDRGTGWSTLADRLGFVVIYPEQQPSNNPQNCFSWFLPGDTAREGGEALSIRQMIERAVGDFGVDRKRVYVTGLSAGGAMTSVMLATYPEVFAGGAIIAGLPYGSAASVQEAFEAMFQERVTSPRALGDRVRAASRHQGPWPRISVWHGGADPVVKPSNAEGILAQWTNVLGISVRPSHDETVDGHLRRVWTAANGTTLIEAFSIAGMGHGVPLAGGAVDSLGASGPFFLEVGISSTQRIARFWGLANEGAKAWNSRSPLPDLALVEASARFVRDSGRAVVPVAVRAETHEAGSRGRLDPTAVIAAAFKAAGLPQPGSASPGAVIEAALKAAGLMRK